MIQSQRAAALVQSRTAARRSSPLPLPHHRRPLLLHSKSTAAPLLCHCNTNAAPLLLHSKSTTAPLLFHPIPHPIPSSIQSKTSMEDEYVQIAGGDEVKLARLREIGSWFEHRRQLVATVQAMCKYLKRSERAAIHPGGVARLHIELLLWAMEQSDSPNPIVRRRWWHYRSKIEKPEDEEPSIYMVPFVRVPWIRVPEESSSTNRRRRNAFVATSLPRRSPRFPRRSPRLTGRRSAAEE